MSHIGDAYRMTSSEAPIVLCQPARLPDCCADITRGPIDATQPLCISQTLLGVVRDKKDHTRYSLLRKFVIPEALLQISELQYYTHVPSSEPENTLKRYRKQNRVALHILIGYQAGHGGWWMAGQTWTLLVCRNFFKI